jgi:pSer/pThr/pTyr-binding forkhead associated (FHA) protein
VHIEFFITRKTDLNAFTLDWDINDRVVFGREITSPVRLEGSEISREHFALVTRDNSVFIEDLSSNGTFINGSRVSRAQWQKVSLGDVIEVPGYQIQIGHSPKSPAPRLPADDPPPSAISDHWKQPFWRFTVWETTIVLVAACTLALIYFYFQG